MSTKLRQMFCIMKELYKNFDSSVGCSSVVRLIGLKSIIFGIALLIFKKSLLSLTFITVIIMELQFVFVRGGMRNRTHLMNKWTTAIVVIHVINVMSSLMIVTIKNGICVSLVRPKFVWLFIAGSFCKSLICSFGLGDLVGWSFFLNGFGRKLEDLWL